MLWILIFGLAAIAAWPVVGLGPALLYALAATLWVTIGGFITSIPLFVLPLEYRRQHLTGLNVLSRVADAAILLAVSLAVEPGLWLAALLAGGTWIYFMHESDKALGFVRPRDPSPRPRQEPPSDPSAQLLTIAKQWFNDTTLEHCTGGSVDLSNKDHFGEWWLFGLWTIVTAVRSSIPDDKASASAAAAFLVRVRAEMAGRGAPAQVLEAGDAWMQERFNEYYAALATAGAPALMAAVAANVKVDWDPPAFAQRTGELMMGVSNAVHEFLGAAEGARRAAQASSV